MKHILSTNESFTIKKGNSEKDVLEELNKISSKIDYKDYSSYQAMVADNPTNGTIGWDGDEEIFYIYDSANMEWKQIEQSEGIPIITVQTTGNVSQQLAPDTFYKFGSIDSLTITLTAGNNLPIYAGKFTASSNWGGVGLNLPATVEEAANNDTIEATKTYEFSILDGIILVKEVA